MSYHFISGLPRSGSTLLASLFCQNPAFHASLQSPLGYSMALLVQTMGPQNEAFRFYTDEQRVRMIEAVFDAYYEDHLDKVVFDNNRRWCSHMALLLKVFPEMRVVCCVRPIPHIIDSTEQLFHKFPMVVSNIYGNTPNTTVYDRVRLLMKPGGLVGYAYDALRTAYFGPHRDRLIIMEYADLARDPAKTMRRVHDELNMPHFEYDFAHVKQLPGAAEFDESIGARGLHDLKPRVLYEPSNSILPPDVYTSLPEAFWQVKK